MFIKIIILHLMFMYRDSILSSSLRSTKLRPSAIMLYLTLTLGEVGKNGDSCILCIVESRISATIVAFFGDYSLFHTCGWRAEIAEYEF